MARAYGGGAGSSPAASLLVPPCPPDLLLDVSWKRRRGSDRGMARPRPLGTSLAPCRVARRVVGASLVRRRCAMRTSRGSCGSRGGARCGAWRVARAVDGRPRPHPRRGQADVVVLSPTRACRAAPWRWRSTSTIGSPCARSWPSSSRTPGPTASPRFPLRLARAGTDQGRGGGAGGDRVDRDRRWRRRPACRRRLSLVPRREVGTRIPERSPSRSARSGPVV